MSDARIPLCQALVFSADEPWRRRLSAALQAAEDADDDEHRDFHLRIDVAGDLSSLTQSCRTNGELQCVVIDTLGLDDLKALVDRLRSLRSELDLFIAVGAQSAPSLARIELVDRDDVRPEALLRRLRSAIARRERTPFADTLRDYVEGARDAWHTPGHSSGDGLRGSPWVDDFYRLMGAHVFNADLSVSVQELDSLLDPLHVIQEAQNLAAKAFGARRTFFVTGGTSMANKVIVQHVMGNGGKMLVDQGCHKSVHHAAILFGVEPVYLPASVNGTFGLYGPVAKASIFAAIDANPDARLLVLTASSYDGFYYDLAPIIDHAHAAQMQVLVDEAWYAHGYFHPELRPCALECGADFVTQSTHKMLSAFSQASMIHIGRERFDESRFREHLNMHTSTSPQYGLIASLDVARKQMSMEGFKRLSQCFAYAQQLRAGINATGVFRALTLDDMLPVALREDGIRLDPSKLTIDVSAAGCSARRIQRLLYERFSIQVEKVTHNTVSVLLTLGTTPGKVLRLINALQSLAEDPALREEGSPARPPVLPSLGHITQLPRDAYFGPTTQLPLSATSHGINRELLGRVSADHVVPYPPGIPVLVPGQRISEDVLEYLLDLLHAAGGTELHGLLRSDGRALLRVTDAQPND